MPYNEKDYFAELYNIETALVEGQIKLAKEMPGDKLAAELTTTKREDLPDSAFALPGRKYPIHDLEHAKNALSRVSQMGTSAERETVRKKVYARYPQLKESFEAEAGVSPTSEKVVKKPRLGQVTGQPSEAKSPRYEKIREKAIKGAPTEEEKKEAAKKGVTRRTAERGAIIGGGIGLALSGLATPPMVIEGLTSKGKAGSVLAATLLGTGLGIGLATGSGAAIGGGLGAAIGAVREGRQEKRELAKKGSFLEAVKEKYAQKIPANIAKSPETSPKEKAKIIALQQAMKGQKKTASEEETYEIGGAKVAKDMPPF
jgi:hypothetical protein